VAQVASPLQSTICDLDELKARPSLLGACLECPMLNLELDAHSLNVRKLSMELLEKSYASVTVGVSVIPTFCESWHDIFHFSKILEEPRRI
jgi:hypothetical protein